MTHNFETQNALVTQDHYQVPAAVDAFDHDDPDASPIRGGNAKFDGGLYYAGKEKTPVEKNRKFVVLNKAQGWQFLKKDCPAEWVMWNPGAPKPEQPECPEETWPMGLDGKPSCPWKWTQFLYLLDVDTGETLTFSSSTSGGKIAISDLTQQITSMRFMKPGAMPVVQLESAMMATKFGKKPRPFFKITGWRARDNGVEEQQQISDQGDDVVEVNAYDDSVPF
jgi:hypothetical protein